jgi:putative solute:sodium symporter small subunit
LGRKHAADYQVTADLVAITFLRILFINQLNQIELLAGFPAGSDLAAQGSPIVLLS